MFYVYESNRKHQALNGFHYTNWNNKIGVKKFYTQEEILSIDGLSETTRKKIESAKPGTEIKMHKLHSCADLCIMRLSDEEMNSIEEILGIHNNLKETQTEIQKTIPDLLKKENDLQKDLENKKKKFKIKF